MKLAKTVLAKVDMRGSAKGEPIVGRLQSLLSELQEFIERYSKDIFLIAQTPLYGYQ